MSNKADSQIPTKQIIYFFSGIPTIFFVPFVKRRQITQHSHRIDCGVLNVTDNLLLLSLIRLNILEQWRMETTITEKMIELSSVVLG